MGTKRKAFINSLKKFGDGRYHYYSESDGTGIGCSNYILLALKDAGIVPQNAYFHAASGNIGILADTSIFERIPWSAGMLQEADILFSQYHHVAAWADMPNSLYEAAPEKHIRLQSVGQV